MRLKFLIALLLVLSVALPLANAGTITYALYDQRLSNQGELEGLYLNTSLGIWKPFSVDNLNDTVVDVAKWATNLTAGTTAVESTASGVTQLKLSGTCNGNTYSNLTWLYNLNQSQDTNTTFQVTTDNNAEIRITSKIPGAGGTNNYTILHPTAAPITGLNVSVYFNFTNQSITYYQAGAAFTTTPVNSWTNIYLQLNNLCNGVAATATVLSYINTTKQSVILESAFITAPSFIFYNNATYGNNLNSSGGFQSIGTATMGATNYSVNIRNLFRNLTSTSTVDGNYYLLVNNNTMQNFSNLFLRVYDEETLQPIFYSLTIANSTNTTAYGSQTSFFYSNYTGVPNGLLTLSFSNGTFYQPRSTLVSFNGYPTLTSPGYQNVSLYLLRSNANVSQITLLIKDPNGAVIPSATVTVSRLINGQYQAVATGQTDQVGSFATYLSTLTQYQFTVTANGYFPLTTYFVPNQPVYTIYLSTGSTGNVTVFASNLTFAYAPINPVLSNWTGDFVTLSVNVTAISPVLSSYGFNFTLANGSTICDQRASNTLGGYLSCTLNISNLTGFGTGVFWYNRTDLNGTASVTVTYTIGEPNYGFVYSARLVDQYWPAWSASILSIILSLMATIVVSRYIGYGSVIVTLGVLGVCTAAGMFDPIVFIIITLLGFAMLVTGRLSL